MIFYCKVVIKKLKCSGGGVVNFEFFAPKSALFYHHDPQIK